MACKSEVTCIITQKIWELRPVWTPFAFFFFLYSIVSQIPKWCLWQLIFWSTRMDLESRRRHTSGCALGRVCWERLNWREKGSTVLCNGVLDWAGKRASLSVSTHLSECRNVTRHLELLPLYILHWDRLYPQALREKKKKKTNPSTFKLFLVKNFISAMRKVSKMMPKISLSCCYGMLRLWFQ